VPELLRLLAQLDGISQEVTRRALLLCIRNINPKSKSSQPFYMYDAKYFIRYSCLTGYGHVCYAPVGTVAIFIGQLRSSSASGGVAASEFSGTI
jgi:hypothetical protein